MFRLRQEYATEVDAALAKYPPSRKRSAVLDLLYIAQAAYGHLTDDAVSEVAEIVEVDPTHVRGLVGFYTLFHDEPHGKFVVQYCNDLPCALRGADEFLEVVVEKLGCRPGETTDDGVFSLETVMCLAACDKAPMMQVNLEYFEELTADKLDALVTELRAKAATGAPRRPPFGLGPPSEVGSKVPMTVTDVAAMPDLASGSQVVAGEAEPPDAGVADTERLGDVIDTGEDE